MNLTEQFTDALQNEMSFIAYSILYAIETGQATGFEDFETFITNEFTERNKAGIADYMKRNPLQNGEIKLYAVPSVKDAPAISLYFAKNPKEVRELHSKQAEYERGKSIIKDVSEWFSLEIDINEQGKKKSLLELKNDAHTIPCYVGQLSEGFIYENGLSINLGGVSA